MWAKHLWQLVDPITNQPLEIQIFEQEGEHIMSGELFSATEHYPIIHGVPRMLTGDLKKDLLQKKHAFFTQFKDQLSPALQQERMQAIEDIKDMNAFVLHQKKTSESFSFEWNNIYAENTFETDNYLHFLWGYQTAKDLVGKVVLDVGCGSGRFTKICANLGAALCIGVDLSEAVDFAFDLTKDIPNIFIVQGDIYHLPFFHSIDIAQSIGVLHHLPDPQWGFTAIAKQVLKVWGAFLIRVYAKKNNARALYLYEPVRYITRHINKRLLLRLCHFPALLVHAINGLTVLLSWIFGKGIIKHFPFYYYINFPYNMKHNDAFDVLATPKSNYYYTENIQKRYSDAGLQDIQGKYLHEAGITFIWTYRE